MNGFFWIASYPKSGNTWLRLFLHSLVNGGSPVDFTAPANAVPHGAARDGFEAALELDSGDLTNDEITCARPRQYESEAADATAPLWRKVHDSWSPTPAGEPLFPPSVTLGAIYLVRDPRDVAVSFAHHNRASIDQTISDMAAPGYVLDHGQSRPPKQLPQHLGSWSGHVQSWLGAADLRRLVVRFEDMAAATQTTFATIVDFLGLSVPPGQVAAAIQAVRFDVLRDAEQRHGFLERPSHAKQFFRRGVAGGWRDTLSPNQIARIEADHGPTMARFGYPLSSARKDPTP